VILAEEWHTVDAILHLDWRLRQADVRHRVRIVWNATNTYSFDRIDWGRLAQAAIMTTVSRYMKHLMWQWGVDPLVMPNGLAADAFVQPARDAVAAFRHRARGRTVVSKVARWHHDKRWLLAVDTMGGDETPGLAPVAGGPWGRRSPRPRGAHRCGQRRIRPWFHPLSAQRC